MINKLKHQKKGCGGQTAPTGSLNLLINISAITIGYKTRYDEEERLIG